MLLRDLTWQGVWHAALALMVVWWAWNYTTWVTNELDPDAVVGAAAPARDHAREPADGGRDPRGVRRSRPPVRRLVRGDPGGAAPVPHLRGGGRGHDRADPVGPHPRLVRGRGCAVAGGRLRRWVGAHRPVARGARDRLRGAARRLLASRPRAPHRRHVGGGDLPFRGALPAVHHHRARRDDRDHRGDDGGSPPGSRARGGVRAGVPVDGGAVVAVLHVRGGDRRAAARARRRGPHEPRARRLHVPARRARRGHHRLGGGRRARDRAPHRHAARRGGGGTRGRPGALPARARALPAADGRHA